MTVDYVLILAAGKGTRMGEIGKEMPKVIWPVFSRSILELEVMYAKKFNPKKIFINLYNNKDKVKKHITSNETFDDVVVIEENSVLDIGGAIHNLARELDYNGRLLVINSDQFIFLKKDTLKNFEEKSLEADVTLLTYDVPVEKGYNTLTFEGSRIIGLTKNKDITDEKCETYTGMSLINLNKLNKNTGESKFFQTVANFTKNNVQGVNIKDSIYWDFGTKDRYWQSMFKICKMRSLKEQDDFISFLEESDAFSEYFYDNENKVIDFSKNKNRTANSIYLSQSNVIGNSKINSLIYLDIEEEV